MTVAAAGTLPWRTDRGRLEVALVHRPKYDDWSWPKGKLDPGEQPPAAAVRETLEETGWSVVLGRRLPSASYAVLDRAGNRDRKHVDYWCARVVGGSGDLVNEIDEVSWMPVAEAHSRLDYARDREQLAALQRMHQAGALETWPLVVVRHTHAVARGSWSGPDPRRPLDSRGEAQARELVPLLMAFAPQRVVSSSSLRCLRSVEPYADATGLSVESRNSLSEEGFAADPGKTVRRMTKVIRHAEPAIVCSHGPVVPTLLEVLASRLHPQAAGDPAVVAALGDQLAKGGTLTAHLVGSGEDARVVAVERHRAGAD